MIIGIGTGVSKSEGILLEIWGSAVEIAFIPTRFCQFQNGCFETSSDISYGAIIALRMNEVSNQILNKTPRISTTICRRPMHPAEK